ncbi:MAG: hypothetical protein LBB45_05140 [Methanobrevibacter sp.]|nr:hypothetical protein [Candidatus Methanovirga basalitermitum]
MIFVKNLTPYIRYIIANKLIAGEISGKKNCVLDLSLVAFDGRHFIQNFKKV